jgi:putative MATE family efflux protein
MFAYLKQDRGFYKGLLVLGIPILVQNLITTSLALIDTFMVGLLGKANMSAVTLANIPVFIIQLMIFGLQSGSSVLISQYWGKKDTDTISRVIGIGCYIAGGVSSLFALVMFCFPVQFIGLFSNNQELLYIAAKFARVIGFSYIFNSITGVYVGAHRSMENPRLGLYIFSISMCLNTFLNWVFIFGNLGAPALGVTGSAVATLSARIVEFFIMAVYAMNNRRFKIRLSLLLRPGKALVRKYLQYATPVVLNETLWGIGTALYPTIMGHMAESTEILAAYTIASNINNVCVVFVYAIAGTTAIVIGREIGAGRAHKVYEVGAALNTVTILTGIVVGGIMLVVSRMVIEPVLFDVFTLTARAAEIASMMLLVGFLLLPFRAFNATNIVGVLRGGGDVRAATIIDLLPLWIVALPLAGLFGLVLDYGIVWVYLAISTESFVKLFFGTWRFRSRAWINDVTKVSFRKGEN